MNKISLIVCTYNRPIYLRQCFDSLLRSDLSTISKLYIIDDHSTDPETNNLINNFHVEGLDVVKIRKGKNQGIKNSLAIGYLLAFEHSNLVVNLDGDAVVKKSWLNTLIELKNKFPENIVCGFNTMVKNRNPILEEHDDFYKKKYASGINMVLNKDQYEDYVLPAISKPIGNWDFDASKLHEADGKSVIVAKPSICAHIGVESSMGHTSDAEPPDVAFDFVDDDDEGERELYLSILYNRFLKDVTLIAVDDNVEGIIKAADISCRDISFGSVKLLSCTPSSDPRVIPIRKLGSKKQYSVFMMKEVVDYIDTPYFMTIQADGYILDGTKWNNNWYNYDYIGSPWNWYSDGLCVGNGAASFRSRRLHEILKEDQSIVPTNDHIIRECQEDHNICRIYRKYLEVNYDIKFAPIDVAERFGIEAWNVAPPYNKYSGQFCYHGGSVDFSGADLPHIPYIKNK